MKGASVLETKKNAGRMARMGVLAALLIAAGILVWQNPLSAVPRPTQPEAAVSPAPTVSGRISPPNWAAGRSAAGATTRRSSFPERSPTAVRG